MKPLFNHPRRLRAAHSHLRSRAVLVPLAAAALAACGLLAASAVGQGKMQSLRIAPKLCKTTGGGKFIRIKGFPGERVDRRLKRDVRWMIRRFDIFITDGYSMDPVHSINGEHPLGLALDIVPDKANGGNWRKVARLARWAEPKQDEPRAPFRWVGWNGDANHGRGHHLHLSWTHSPAKPGRPARVVYTRRCPKPLQPQPDAPETETDQPTQEPPPSDGTGGGPSADPNGQGGVAPKRTRQPRATGGVRIRAAERRRFARRQDSGPKRD